MSKGTKPRPLSISYKEYCRRWDKIFKCNKSHKPNKEILKSMELTSKGIGLTEYDTVEKMLKDLSINDLNIFCTELIK